MKNSRTFFRYRYVLFLFVLAALSGNVSAQDSDFDGISDADECEGTTSSLSMDQDFPGNTAANNGGTLSLTRSVPEGANISFPNVSPVNTTITFNQMGNDVVVSDCFFQITTSGRFDDGLTVEIDGVVVLNFNANHWINDPDFRGSGKFNSSGSGGGTWTPWTNEGSPTLNVTSDGTIQLLVNTRNGGREDALDDMNQAAANWVFNTTPLTTADCAAGTDVLVQQANMGGPGRRPSVTISASVGVCADSDGDGTPDFQDPCAPSPVAQVIQVTPESACLDEDGSAQITLSGGMAGTSYTATATNTSTGAVFTVTQNVAPYNFLFNGLTAGDYVVDIESGNSVCMVNQLTFTVGGELVNRPAGAAVAPILWLRADQDVTSSGTQVTRWNDQSPAGNDALSDGTTVTYDFAGDVMNFNPGIRFDPTDDPLARLVGEEPLNLVNGPTMDDFTFFIVPRIIDPEGGNCGDDVFNFFDSENLFEVENLVPKDGCEAFVNNFTYGVFNGGETSFSNTENRDRNIIGIDFSAPGGAANFNAYGNGANTLLNQINPYQDPQVDANSPYSVGQALQSRVAGNKTATMEVGEVLVFPTVLSQADRERVNTYLAIKYGVDLVHDYVDGDGNVVWDTDGTRAAFSNSVAGIARDDCSTFEQRQSSSAIQNTIVTIGNGEIADDNASNPNDAGNDLSYLLWGHNGAQPAFLGQSGSTNFANRYNRTYKVSEYVGGVVSDAYQDLDIAFNRSNAELIGPDYTYALLIDRDGDGDFSNAEEFTGGVTDANGELVFEGIDLDHDDCFTLGRPTCDLDIMSIIADCDNGDEFEITIDIDYTYFSNSAATPGTINVFVGGQTYSSDPLTDVTGNTSITFPVVGNFSQISLIAEFSTDNLCSDAEFLNLVNCDLACVAQPDAISGNVFPDYDLNGVRNVGEASVPGVTVNVYDCDGVLVGTAVTGLDGSYNITGLNPAEDYRVEFVNPNGNDATPTYVDSGNDLTNSDVRFVTAGACNLNLGVINPDFCTVDKLQFVSACFSRLNPAQNPNADALVSFLGSGGGNSNDVQDYLTPPEHPISVGIGEVGPVNGLAYDRKRQRLYASTTVKAETMFPAGGSIADVYVIDNSTNDRSDQSVTMADRLVNFDTDCGISVGTYRTDFNTPGALNDGVDDQIFEDVGKVGIGDIDLGIGGRELYATNLFSRSLIVLPLDDDGEPLCGQSLEVPVPVPADCAGTGVVRPWAIGRQSGEADIYVGAVCDASISQDPADLMVYVFRFRVATNTFDAAPVLAAPLDYPRQTNFASDLNSDWLPWVDDINDAANTVDIRYCCGNTYFVSHPQPILADIEFDRGDIILGFIDRFANQLSQIPATSPKAFSPGDDFILPAGDMLRAGLNADLTTFTLENNAMTNGAVAGPLTTQGATIDYPGTANDLAGPGGGEFYYQDDYYPNSGHFETTVGGLALVPGQALAVNAFDPVRGVPVEFATGGVNFYNSTTGSWIKSYKLYGGVGPDVPGNFGKGAGFGDLEPVCEPIRVQIGNYVFADNDEDGVQDACDTPIAGVPVALYNPDGTLRATTVTDAEGEYYFSGPSATTETWFIAGDSLMADDEVIIVFGLDPNNAANTVFDTSTVILSVGNDDYTLTLDNEEAAASGDRADSDAELTAAAGLPWDGFPTIRAILGDEQTNFSFDAGFIPQTLDLALIKTIDDPLEPRMRGELVEFTITVINQGTKPVRSLTVSDYLTNGLSFGLADNQGVTVVQTTGGPASTSSTFMANWSFAGADPSLPLTVPGTRGLAPSDTLRIPIFITLTGTNDLVNERFVNRAEISSVTDLQGMDVSGDDIDSTPDAIRDNDAGGRLNTSADNALDGDGTGSVNGIFSNTDEDDADPALVPIFDLALTKLVNVNSLGPDGMATFGETVEFFITVVNQGTLTASDISVYDDVPCGYSAEDANGNLLPANQANWTGNNVDGVTTTIGNALLPGQSVRRSLFLTLIQPDEQFCKDQNDTEPFTNSAEIASARTPDGTLREVDFDSVFDEDDDVEDGGGVVNDLTDNVVTGDGSGVAGSNNPFTDDDDQDVANVDVIDVALRKYQDETQAAGQTIFSVGETVKFQIALLSQGNVPVDTFDVVDYLPEGLDYNAALNDPLGWSYDPVTRRAVNTGIPADGIIFGDSVRVCLYADVNNFSLDPADYVNRAEITRFYIDPMVNDNLPGLPPLAPGYRMQDADSFQDDDPDNDLGGEPNTPDDNNVDGLGFSANEDEDDADPAQVFVVQPVVIGDTTFIDVDMNGIQSPGDLPIGNVTVYITNADGTPVTEDALGNPYMDTLLTDANGFYLFDSLPEGNYVVTFDFSTIDNPELYEFTGADAGADDSIDSDAAADGSTPPTGPLMGGDTVLTIDAGLVCILEAEAGTADPICEDDVLDLTTLGASVTPASLGGVWSTAGDGTFNGGGTFDGATTYTPGSADIAAGSVVLTLRNDFTPAGSGCEPASDDVTLVINDLPEVDAGEPQIICENETVSLSGTSGGGTTSVTWTTSGDGTFDDANSLTAEYTPGTADMAAAPGTITLTLTSNDPAGPCPAVTDDVVITLDDLPTVDAGPDQTICETETATLAGSSGGGFTGAFWTTAGDGTFDSASKPDAVYTPGTADLAAGMVTLTYQTLDPAGPCPAVSDEVVITFNQAATEAEAGPNQTVCVDDQVMLTGSASTPDGTAVPGSWTTTGGGTLTDAGDGTATYDALPAEAGTTVTFTYTSDDLNGCGTVSDMVMVAFTDAVATVEAGADQVVCVDDQATVTGVITTVGGTNPTDGTWSITTGSGTLTDNGDGTATYDAVAADIATDVVLTYTSADLNGCGTVSDDVTIDFEDAVATVEAGADQTVCVDDQVNLSGEALTVGGSVASGTWTTTGGGTLTDNGDGTATYDAQATEAGTTISFTYTSEDLNGCGIISDVVEVTFNDAAALVDAGMDQTACIDATVLLSATAETANGMTVPGSWSTDGAGTLTDEGDGTATYDADPSEANMTVNFTYETNDLNGCGTVSDDMTVSFNALPTVSVADQTVCEEDMITFTAAATATSGGTLTYQWQHDGTGTFENIFNETNQTLVISEVPLAFDGRQYRVIVTETANGIMCDSPASEGIATLTVNPLPPCDISGDAIVAANTQDQPYTGPSGNFTYAWTIIDGDATIDAGTEDDQTVLIDFGVMDVTIGLTVTDAVTGCARSCQFQTGTANLSLGSTVFEDLNNNGMQDPGEAGLPNVQVQLFDAATGNQILTGNNGNVVTDANGFYFFENLPQGDYIVQIPVSNFQPGANNALDSLNVSSNATSSGFTEIDPDAGDVDGDDNGLQPGGQGTEVQSLPVTLTLGGEPVNGGTETGTGNTQDDGAFDDSGNMTVDFGFFSPVLRIGDFVFVDLDGDGQQGAGEPGIGGVTVTLFNGDGSPVMFEADGTTPYPNTVMTAADGSYLFEDLPPGDYFVTFDLSTADNAELYVFTAPNQGDDATDSDAVSADGIVGTSATTPFLNGGQEDLTLDAGVICNISVTVAEPFTICRTQPIDLSQGASITPASLGGFWTTDGNGTFLDADGNELTAPADFATAVSYLPGETDARRGNVTLTLTTNDPGALDPASPCEPVASSVTIQVLQVDCGEMFWDGGGE